MPNTPDTHNGHGESAGGGVRLPDHLRYVLDLNPGAPLSVYKQSEDGYAAVGKVSAPGYGGTFLADAVTTVSDAILLVDSVRGIGVQVKTAPKAGEHRDVEDLEDNGLIGRYAVLLGLMNDQISGMPPILFR
jgi:hypothetical protein